MMKVKERKEAQFIRLTLRIPRHTNLPSPLAIAPRVRIFIANTNTAAILHMYDVKWYP